MSKNAFSLASKVIVITGAAGGIGMEVCRQLGGDGAKLIMADIDEVGLAAGKAELAARGVSAVTFKANSSVEADVIALFKFVAKEFGMAEILVNNAAAGTHTPPQDTTLEIWDTVIGTSLTGYFLNAREFSKLVIAAKKPGAIVNISSIAGSSAIGRGNFAYSVAKGGVNQMTRELAIEWAK